MIRTRARILVSITISLLAVYYFFSAADPSCAGLAEERFVRVVRVHDGDTISVMMGRKKERVRLIGIDAPEMGQRPWGGRAKRHLEELLGDGQLVSLEFDVERRDKYRRLLAYVRIPDGTFINLRMIKDGYAVLFTFPPNVRHVNELREAQRYAREKRLGIWGKDGLKETPLDYKRTHPR